LLITFCFQLCGLDSIQPKKRLFIIKDRTTTADFLKFLIEKLLIINEEKLLTSVTSNFLHLGQGNPQYQYRLGMKGDSEKDVGVLVNEKLDMSHQCALTEQKANCILACIKSSMASRSREGILPLCSAQTPPGVLRPALEPSAQERHGAAGAGPEEGHKNVQRARTPLLRGKAERVGAVQPEEQKALGRPYCSLSVPEGGLQERMGKPF